jgi:hypothetical protein
MILLFTNLSLKKYLTLQNQSSGNNSLLIQNAKDII